MRSLLGATYTSTASGGASYVSLCGRSQALPTATEANTLQKGLAGTVSKLAVNINGVGVSRVFAFRNNGSTGNQSISISDGASGTFEDTTHSDTIAENDPINASLTWTTGTNPRIFWVRAILEGSSGTVGYAKGLTDATTSGTTRYRALAGAVVVDTTESNTQELVRGAGTVQKGAVRLTANTGTLSGTATFRKNSADTSIAITWTGGATGTFEDLSTTVSVASGDLINWKWVPGNELATVQGWVQHAIAYSSALTDHWNGTSTGKTASATATYFSVVGASALIATESDLQITPGFPGTISKLRIGMVTNTTTGSVTWTVRKNGSNTAVTISAAAATTGRIEDTTHSATFAATDTLSISNVGGTSGSYTAGPVAVSIQADAQAYSLTVGTGSYSLTGKAVTLKRGLKVAAAKGTYSLSGQAVTLRYARKALAVGAGAYTLSGQAVGLKPGYKVPVVAGAYTLSGQSVGFRRTYAAAAAVGAYTLSGQSVVLKRGLKVPVATGSYTLSGQAVGLKLGHKAPAGVGAYSLSGKTATLRYARTNLAVAAGSYALSGQAVTLRRGLKAAIAAGAYTLSGQDISFSFVRKVQAAVGAYTLAGQDVALKRFAVLAVAAGAYSLSGQATTSAWSETARPDSDISESGTWVDQAGGTTNLYSVIDELVADDADYVRSPPLNSGQNSELVVGLGNMPDPGVSSYHRVRYRFRKNGGATMNFTIGLYQGATEIASWTHNDVSTDWVDGDQTLSGAEADSITDYSDLRLRLYAEAA